MGRLIDADKFMKTVLRIKRLNEERQLSDIDLENEKINNYETGQRETFDLITENLDAQPTAYDPHKVVEQLESELRLADKEKEQCVRENPLQFDSAKGYAMGLSNAIEIVKGGGVDAEH